MIGCFRSGKIPILIVTDITAKGLEFTPNVKHIINFDLPSDIDEYVMRIIHTGQKGNTGVTTSFFNDKNMNIARELVKLLDRAFQDVPIWLQESANEYRRNKDNRRNWFG